jgi:hypothetical protein
MSERFALRQVRNYYTSCWRRSPAPFEEQRILAELHGPLRSRVLAQIGAQARPDIPILQVIANHYCQVIANHYGYGGQRMKANAWPIPKRTALAVADGGRHKEAGAEDSDKIGSDLETGRESLQNRRYFIEK